MDELKQDILEEYMGRMIVRIQGCKDDLLSKTDSFTKQELIQEFAKWAKVALICEMEDMINGK